MQLASATQLKDSLPRVAQDQGCAGAIFGPSGGEAGGGGEKLHCRGQEPQEGLKRAPRGEGRGQREKKERQEGEEGNGPVLAVLGHLGTGEFQNGNGGSSGERRARHENSAACHENRGARPGNARGGVQIQGVRKPWEGGGTENIKNIHT